MADKEMTPWGIKGGFAYNLHCLKMYNLVAPIINQVIREQFAKAEKIYNHRRLLDRQVGGQP